MIKQFIDFYTKKEYRFEMIRAVIGIVFIWFIYFLNGGII